MPGNNNYHAQVIRATTPSPWWSTSFEGQVDLSDHHPCEWSIGELNGITYNVQFLPFNWLGPVGKNDANAISEASKRIAHFLSREHATYDVICLQELFNNTANLVLEEELKKKGYIATKPVGGYLGSPLHGGIRIFYKQDVLGTDFKESYVYKHTVDTIKRGDAMVDKGIKHIKLQKNGKTYHVFNTHLQAFYEDTHHQHYVEVTLAQLIELRKYILVQKKLGIIQKDEQVVICGDFNIPKNAKGASLENTDALFKRAQLILGEEFQLVEPSSHPTAQDSPRYSFDPSTNIYLSGALGDKSKVMHANLDLVFTLNTTKRSSHPILDHTVRYIQNQLSIYLQQQINFVKVNKFEIWPLDVDFSLYQFSESDREMIVTTSKALDALIVKMTHAGSISSDPFENPELQALMDFSKALPIFNQFILESALTATFLEQCGYKTFDIETIANLWSIEATTLENMEDLRLGLKELRLAAMKNISLDVEQVGLMFSRIQFAKPEFSEAVKKIALECVSLREAGEIVAAEAGELLCFKLNKALEQYLFSLTPEKEKLETFRNSCLDALKSAKPALTVHIGIRKSLAEFFTKIGEKLNLNWFKSLGAFILSTEPKAIQLLGHFRERVVSSTLHKELCYEDDLSSNAYNPNRAR